MGKMVVYLTNLGRYNEGVLQGRWLKLPASKEALEKVLDEIVGGVRFNGKNID